MREYRPILALALVWGVAFVVIGPRPLDILWATFLLLLAPLVLVPLGLLLVRRCTDEGEATFRLTEFMQAPAALSLGAAYLLPRGMVAAALALPWLLVTALLALLGLARARRHAAGPLGPLCLDLALVYLAVGSAWAVLDRWGVRPLGFEPVIVLLTAIHFHYAGFVLPLITGLVARQTGGRGTRIAAVGVLAGVPLVAVGITSSQLQLGVALEGTAAWVLGLSGLAIGCLQLRLALVRAWPRPVRFLWTVAGISLIAGMVLAILYGSRHYLPIAGLDIPWMRAVHGTANALGFALVGLIGWTLALTPAACVRTASGPSRR